MPPDPIILASVPAADWQLIWKIKMEDVKIMSTLVLYVSLAKLFLCHIPLLHPVFVMKMTHVVLL